jgi:hypothetical protein
MYRKYINRISYLTLYIYPPPLTGALPLTWPVSHPCPSLFKCLLLFSGVLPWYKILTSKIINRCYEVTRCLLAISLMVFVFPTAPSQYLTEGATRYLGSIWSVGSHCGLLTQCHCAFFLAYRNLIVQQQWAQFQGMSPDWSKLLPILHSQWLWIMRHGQNAPINNRERLSLWFYTDTRRVPLLPLAT